MRLLSDIALVAAILAAILAAGIALYYRARLRLLRPLNARLARRQSAQDNFLQRIGACLNSSLELEPALEIILEHIMAEAGAAAGAAFLLDPAGKSLRARAVIGPLPVLHESPGQMTVLDPRHAAILLKNTSIALGEGIIGFVAATGEPLLITDARGDNRLPKAPRRGASMAETLIITPLKLQQKIQGVIAIANKSKGSGRAAFDEQDLQVVQILADQAALTIYLVRLHEQLAERQQLEKELLVAQNFQKMLLPAKPPEIDGYDIAAFNRPAREVGGDYYDFIQVDPDHLGIVIADVSGKGIPGALVMATMRSTLRAEAVGQLSPGRALRHANRRMLQDTQSATFITLIYAILDIPRRRLRFVRAGHEPLIVWSAVESQPRVHSPEGIALGMVEDSMFDILEETEIALAPGDSVVLFTDGAVEVANSQNEEYGLQRLLERLADRRDAASLAQIQYILAGINDFAGGTPHQDDITLVAIRIPADRPRAASEPASQAGRRPEPQPVGQGRGNT